MEDYYGSDSRNRPAGTRREAVRSAFAEGITGAVE